MKVIFKSLLGEILLTIENSKKFEGKNPEEVYEYFANSKQTHTDEEGNIVGYECDGYLLEEDFTIEVEP